MKSSAILTVKHNHFRSAGFMYSVFGEDGQTRITLPGKRESRIVALT